jgi:hypothetical protein
VLRQHSANWDLRFAYELNGTCALRGTSLAGKLRWRRCSQGKTRSKTARPAGSSSAAKSWPPAFYDASGRGYTVRFNARGSASS